MASCDVCKTIPFENLPAFPNDSCILTLSGLPNFQKIVYRPADPNESFEDIFFKHHPDLASLRSAADNGCGLCRLIESQADAVLADIDDLKDRRGIFQCQPRFDLWLTKRSNRADGFWVVTNSTWQTGKYIIPVAAIGFSAEYDSSLASSLKGRPIRELPDKAVLDWAVKTVSACDGHDKCVVDGRPIPPLVIDVGSAESADKLQLVELPSGTSERYVALSYIAKTDDSSASYTQGDMNLKSLPKTFQDAVAVVQALGVKYLWLDEICIPPHAREDWTRSSANYAAVFINAYLTVAATGSKDKTTGLFLPRKSRGYVSISGEMAGKEGSFKACTQPLDKETISSFYVDMRTEPLSKDIWAFQEGVLSRRVLHFASDQVYFECLECFMSEDGLSMTERYFRHSIFPEKDPEPEIKDWRANLSPEDILSRKWYSALREYGRRNAQNSSERLGAMANIAREFAKQLNDDFFVGLWKNNMFEGLCWQALEVKGILEGPAPSWSWASLDGMAATGFITKWEPVATIETWSVNRTGTDPFLDLKNAEIVLQAPLIPLELSDAKGPTGYMLLKAKHSTKDGWYAGFDTINRNHSDSAELVVGMQLFALVLAVSGIEPKDQQCFGRGCSMSKTYHSLIVTPVENEPVMKVKRLGFLLQNAEGFGDDDLGAPTAVTLV